MPAKRKTSKSRRVGSKTRVPRPTTSSEGLHAAAVLQGLSARLGMPILVFPWGDGFRIVNHHEEKEVFLSADGSFRDVAFSPEGAPHADPSKTHSG